MAETKTRVAIKAAGFAPGDRVWVGSVYFGDEHDPAIDIRTVPGFHRTKDDAKRAIEAEIGRRSASETRHGWWEGDVEEGIVRDRSADWGSGYGWVEDWEFEHDDRDNRDWFACGEWQR